MCVCESCAQPHQGDTPQHTVGPVTDTLRTRIAAAIYDSCEKLAKQLLLRENPMNMAACYRLADDAIRELGLTQQWLSDGIISDGEPRPWELPCETRYATDWERFDG